MAQVPETAVAQAPETAVAQEPETAVAQEPRWAYYILIGSQAIAIQLLAIAIWLLVSGADLLANAVGAGLIASLGTMLATGLAYHRHWVPCSIVCFAMTIGVAGFVLG